VPANRHLAFSDKAQPGDFGQQTGSTNSGSQVTLAGTKSLQSELFLSTDL
jgi:hypothetical protein